MKIVPIEDGLMSVKVGDNIFLSISNLSEGPIPRDMAVFKSDEEINVAQMHHIAASVSKEIKGDDESQVLVPVQVTWADDYYVQLMLVMPGGILNAPSILERTVNEIVVAKNWR